MELDLENSIRLVTGKGMWHTSDCGGALPSIQLADGPHGLRKQEEGSLDNNDSKLATCFPTASALACSWDEAAAAALGTALGREARREAVAVLLGPGINIKRSPLCGRNFEYYSEDPYLAGRLGTAYVKAVQEQGVAVSLKHFAGNSQETRRQTSNSQIDERALREIYLPAFEAVVKEAKPATVMASYNRLNGEYACESRRLLTEILREEWGFEGAVISDWGACVDLAKCLRAGMDLEMPDSLGLHSARLRQALQRGEIGEADIRRAAARVAALVERCTAAQRPTDGEIDVSRNHDLARELACESAVLLKNDGALPLPPAGRVTLIGALAREMRFQGGGSSHIHTAPVKNLIDALREKGVCVTFAAGYDAGSDRADAALEQEAAALAAQGGTVLFCGGLTERCEGEGYDRKSLSLPENQLSLFERLAAVNKNIVYLSFSGAPYDIAFAPRVRAILHMYLGGEAVAEACAALLLGERTPCGKLAETFPFTAGDTPCAATFATGSNDVEYRESLFVGYRYYDSFQVPVRFPFGFGLSYTTFAYSDLRLSAEELAGGELTVSFTVRNTGAVAGAEIAQLYVVNPAGGLRPARELRGFAKVKLAPGEERRVTLTLTQRSFSLYDARQKRFLVPGGVYHIQIAAALDDVRLEAALPVAGEAAERDSAVPPAYFDRAGRLKGLTHEDFLALYGRETSHFDAPAPGSFTVYSSLGQLSEHSWLARLLLRVGKAAVYRRMKDKRRDDPAVQMMIEMVRDGTLDAVACQSGGLISSRLEEALVLSANGQGGRAFRKLLKG